MTSRWWWSLALVAFASAGCSSSDSPVAATTSLPPSALSSQGSQTVPATAPPEPTGVPGLDAADPFCSAWASYVGTLQALGVASSFGALSSQQFAALELAAAPRLAAVAAEIDAVWPADLEAERTVVIEQRVGPYARRAGRGVDALRDAGVSDADLDAMASGWQDALSARDPDVPVIELAPSAADLQAKFDVAAAAYDGAITPFAQDPSLVVDAVVTPATDAYLVAHCPDLASSGVGDAL